ncbi:hypothetical protein FACS189413_08660 [Bacteroidia bacterium]|nr:hypothetical protein FACS189413_08660 [Bacteroidia bacterium]
MRSKHKILVLAFCCLPFALPAQIQTLQYWFDSNFAGRITQATQGNTVQITELQTTGLSEGLHLVHIRAKDDTRWSVVHSKLFYKVSEMSDNAIVQYEYWSDGNFAERISQNISGEIVMINNLFENNMLATGLHTVSIRAKDAAGRWSTVHTQAFYKGNILPEGGNKIAAYRYWYDNDFTEHQSVILETPVTPYEINPAYELPATLSEGKHAFHIQFRDLSGQWSVATTDTFELKRQITAIHEISANDISIYPNPVCDKLEIQTETQIKNIDILDLAGRNVITSSSVQINVSALLQGAYLLKIQTGNGIVIKKFIKE